MIIFLNTFFYPEYCRVMHKNSLKWLKHKFVSDFCVHTRTHPTTKGKILAAFHFPEKRASRFQAAKDR
jgi:hypothetical protein